MSLKELLDLESKHKFKKEEVNKEFLLENLPKLKKQIAYYRVYPDIFIDDISGFWEWILKLEDE